MVLAHSGRERATQPAHAQHRHHPFQIMGQHLQAHLGPYRLQAFAQEVGSPQLAASVFALIRSKSALAGTGRPNR
jgi:hypothetical protein